MDSSNLCTYVCDKTNNEIFEFFNKFGATVEGFKYT